MKALKHYLRFVLPTLLVAAVMMTSCSSGANKEGAVIPKDALFVATLDLGSVWEKGELKKANDLKIVKEIHKNLKEESPNLDKIVNDILSDPESSGIDFGKNVTLFATQEGRQTYFVVSATMKDNEKFEALFSKMKKAKLLDSDFTKKIDKKNGLKLMLLEDVSIIYNDDRVLLVTTDRYDRDDEKTEYGIELFSLKSEDAISSLSSFNEFWSNRHDAAIFIPYSSSSNMGGMGGLYSGILDNVFDAILDSDEQKQLEEAGLYFAVSFEKGSIDIHSGTCGVPKKLKKIADASFNKDLIDYMPEKTYAAATLAINTDYIIEVLESDKDTKKILKQKIDIKKYTVRDLLESLGGSVVVSLHGFSRDGEPLIAGAIDIKNADLVKAAIKEMGLEKEGGYYNLHGAYLYLGNGVIVASNDQKVVKKAATGGYGNGMKAIASKAKSGSFFYVNLDINQYPAEIKEGAKEAKKYYGDDVYDFITMFSSAEISKDGDNAVFHLFFKKDDNNSLAMIIKSLDKMIANGFFRPKAYPDNYYDDVDYTYNEYDNYYNNVDEVVADTVALAY